MTQTSIVLIGPETLLALWSAIAPSRDVLTSPQDDLPRALELIRRHRPSMVVIDEAFAFSAEAAALVARLQTDSEFKAIDVRVLVAEAAATLRSIHAGTTPVHGGISLAALTRPLPGRAVRLRPARPVAIHVNGAAAALINLSESGTQVRSTAILRPNERVRLSFRVQHGAPVRLEGVVVWSALEHARIPTYRAGIKLAMSFRFSPEEMLSQLLDADSP